MNCTLTTLIALSAVLTMAACSSAPKAPSGAGNRALAGANEGPVVLGARSEPSMVELNRDFQPMRPAEVLADVKDFNARISDVKLQFEGLPLEVPMENIGGTTWRALFTPRHLEMLSVSGQTVRYEAHVVVRDEEGKVGSTTQPVEVSVRAPDLSAADAVGAG